MNKFLLVWTVVLIVVVGCTSPVAPSMPEPTPEPTAEANPEDVIKAANEAWNAGDVETLKALFAEDAVACFPDWGDECTTGAEEIAAWIEDLVASNFVIEPNSIEVEEDTVTVLAQVWADPTRELGIAPLVTQDVYTVEGGRITSQTSTLSEESAAKLMEAMAAAERMAVVNAVNEAWNAGDVETLKALFAEDAVACFPDWGDECTTGAEEIAAWIEELVASNFVIEPESIEEEGDTVTVVAQVWADPTRELGIAPLVTRDVYTVEGGRITSQTSTLTEESAAKLEAAMASQPRAVVTAYVDAINAGDFEAAMALCDDGMCADLTPILMPGFPDPSAEQEGDVRAWFEEARALNLEIETEIVSVAGNTVTTRSQIWSDYLRTLNAAPLVLHEVIEVRDGQIQSWNRTTEESSQEGLQVALARSRIPSAITPRAGEVLVSEASDLIGTWTYHLGETPGPLQFKADGTFLIRKEGITPNRAQFRLVRGFLLLETKVPGALDYCESGTAGYAVFMTRAEGNLA
ncbi:MAG: nuclear transport factor 2 family protein, partial [Anaerolineae bacterium]